jgi:hypothetical protein
VAQTLYEQGRFALARGMDGIRGCVLSVFQGFAKKKKKKKKSEI